MYFASQCTINDNGSALPKFLLKTASSPMSRCPKIKLLALLRTSILIKHTNVMEYLSQCLNCVPQGSVLDPLLFLVYINDLTDNITSDKRVFADDSSLFTCIKGINQTHEKLVQDLQTVSMWAYQWKMVFNPD